MTDYRHPDYPRIATENLKGRDGFPYHADDGLLAAANAALALQMPLLLTGEAGCGKTDFAFAVASALDTPLEESYVRSDSVARDLLYHHDTILRFGDAHHGGEAGLARAEDPRNYIELKPLGRALVSDRLCVVLIDEIDKAPRDLPNDLLRELDQGRFEIPEIPAEKGETKPPPVDPDDRRTFRTQMQRPNLKIKPMVMITSNVERQLPDPFLRRCVFFHIRFPGDEDLKTILRSRFPKPERTMIEHAVKVFGALRDMPNLTKKPTTSELINWFEAMHEVFDPNSIQERLQRFAGDSRPGWKELPALSCLVKLREDLERLGASA